MQILGTVMGTFAVICCGILEAHIFFFFWDVSFFFLFKPYILKVGRVLAVQKHCRRSRAGRVDVYFTTFLSQENKDHISMIILIVLTVGKYI